MANNGITTETTSPKTTLKQPAQWAIDELKQLCDDVVETCTDVWDAEGGMYSAEDDFRIAEGTGKTSARLDSCIADVEYAHERHESAQRRVIEFIDTYNEVHSKFNGDSGFNGKFIIDGYGVVTINRGATRHPAPSVIMTKRDNYQTS